MTKFCAIFESIARTCVGVSVSVNVNVYGMIDGNSNWDLRDYI